MNRSILARNLLLNNELSTISQAFNASNIPLILLKGIALTHLFPEYSKERLMDDIDLLIQPKHIKDVRKILNSLKYKSIHDDPGKYYNTEKGIYLDIADNIWYLNKNENTKIWDNSRNYSIYSKHNCLTYHLPPDEFYIHVLAHAAIHHGTKHDIWLKDLELLREKWEKDIDWHEVDNKLAHYGLFEVADIYLNNSKSKSVKALVYKKILERNIPRKGHLLRFLFLPLKKKLSYLTNTMFPSDDFLKHRYGLNTYIYRFLRPILLVFKLCNLLITTQFTILFGKSESFSKNKNT